MSTFSDVQASLDGGGQLLDVRTPEEYSTGYVQGATNLPLQDIQNGTMPGSNKDQVIFVYCSSGNRSSQATALLKEAGFTNVTDLGAITHVEDIGGNIVAGP